MIRAAAIGTGLLLAGCTREAPVPALPESRAERLALLDRIAAECRVSRSAFTLAGAEELRVDLGGEERFERVECVLRRVDGLNIPPGKLHFVVGQAAAPEANHAQTR
jgi:hypothetical protein